MNERMLKRVIPLLSLLILLAVVLAACSPQLKTASRSADSTATRTPFLVKATFTSEVPPGEMAGNLGAEQLPETGTNEPLETDQNPEQAAEEEASPTGTQEKEATDPSATPKPAQPTATPKPTQPPATSKPTKPPATSKPTQPPADTSTLKPPADTSTPKPPAADTNTPKPPTDTSTPKPPTDTNTPKPTTAVPTATSSVCLPSGNSAYEDQVITLINQERAAVGLASLTKNSKLTTAARSHSDYMACSDHFSHTWMDGTKPWDRVTAAGYSWSRVTENIAASTSQSFSPASVVNLWMNSPGHKANILDPNVVHIGVGFRFFDNGGYDAYYTAVFARP